MGLDEKYYPKILPLIYKLHTNRELNLKNPKTFSEKIQWLKICDNLPIKSTLTDKILVRDWVKDILGEEYLKPVLWIGNNFEDIPWNTLPESFILKCNHGCKWQVIIKNKTQLLKTGNLYSFLNKKFNKYLSSNWFPHSFEPQYKTIIPKIFVEELLTDTNGNLIDIEVFCANGSPSL